MRFNVIINQCKCIDAGLNVNQAALMGLFGELATWATVRIINGDQYWHISRNKVIEEIPLFYQKADTVYRSFKLLAAAGMIEYVHKNRMDFVRLTSKGMVWNKVGTKSEFTPQLGNESGQLGNESEFPQSINRPEKQQITHLNSELNPTDNINNNTSNNISAETAFEFLQKNHPQKLEMELMKFKTKIPDFETFVDYFNNRADKEDLKFNQRVLLGAMKMISQTWIRNLGTNKNFNNNSVSSAGVIPMPKRNVFKAG